MFRIFLLAALLIVLLTAGYGIYSFLKSRRRKKKDGNIYPELADYESVSAPMGRAGGLLLNLAMMKSTSAPSAEEPMPQPVSDEFNTEEYKHLDENPFQDPKNSPLSTFSIDVDTASYANFRRFINETRLPPPSAIRIEEFINYFKYDYATPSEGQPFSVNLEAAQCPWNSDHKLVHIGLQGKTIDTSNLPPSNLVFLIDKSGSMGSENKLPLLKKSFKLLLDQLGDKDFVSIVWYASNVGVALPPTPANQRDVINRVLDSFQAEGATSGGGGIALAYEQAKAHFMAKGNNRVIVATDGDFNIGTTAEGSLVEMIEEKRKSGVYLTLCGFGMGNYKDSKMKEFAKAGGGNYFYIDSELEAKKVFKTEMHGTLFTIAKDVKIQVEFNPAKVQAYRLIGYETKMMKAQDFNDDKKRASELGAGHTVTALYEIIPPGVKSEFVKNVDDLKYQQTEVRDGGDELLTVKLRYKLPDQESSQLITEIMRDTAASAEAASENFKFSAAVAALGLIMKESKHKSQADFPLVLRLAKMAKGKDDEGYRAEFIRLAEISEMRKSTVSDPKPSLQP